MFSFFTPNIKPVQRNFNPAYLLDKSQQEYFEKEGYVVIRNVLTELEIEEIKDTYKIIQADKDFEVKNKFESSGNFQSAKLQTRVFNYIEEFMKRTSNRYANLENCEVGTGGAFFIKPNTEESKLEPHQDSAVIDESKYYAVFVWMPLVNINEKNGALYVLPKSHLWGNYYRSQHIRWAFNNISKFLWKYMQPIYVDKGDIVLFDSSIIHGSEVNQSDTYRIVLCGALLPKQHQKVDYVEENKKIIQYCVDDKYWLDGGQKGSLAKYKKKEVHNIFPNPVNKRALKKLIQES